MIVLLVTSSSAMEATDEKVYIDLSGNVIGHWSCGRWIKDLPDCVTEYGEAAAYSYTTPAPGSYYGITTSYKIQHVSLGKQGKWYASYLASGVVFWQVTSMENDYATSAEFRNAAWEMIGQWEYGNWDASLPFRMSAWKWGAIRAELTCTRLVERVLGC